MRPEATATRAIGGGPGDSEDQRIRPERRLERDQRSTISSWSIYVPEIVRTKLISRHHDDSLANHFGINKTREVITQKYYWPTLHYNVETYVIGCNVCLASKSVSHKPYGDL